MFGENAYHGRHVLLHTRKAFIDACQSFIDARESFRRGLFDLGKLAKKGRLILNEHHHRLVQPVLAVLAGCFFRQGILRFGSTLWVGD